MTFDCASEMSLDYEYLGEDEDDLDAVGEDSVAELQVDSPMFDVAVWNPHNFVNESVAEDAYMEFRLEKEFIDETDNLLNSVSDWLQTHRFILTAELAESMI
ncbi:UNVERIFIED_CONTAM: hypothetical protein HDU68_004306 [Siphonaria sp. JEL0065]|nr:hypothetical protein HDU68_004306 [Siphonaria sp. JEL0065]